MKFFSAIILLIFSTLALAQTNDANTPSYQQAPQWTLNTQSGEQKSYTDYKGKPLIITFWGTWCPYCKKLHPRFEQIAAYLLSLPRG